MTLSKTNSGLYYSSKKLSNGQTIVMLFSAYAVNGSGTFYNVGLAIGKNRKQCLSWYDNKTKYLSGHETGKSTNVKEVLNFCLNILKEFEEYLVSQNKNSCIVIEGAESWLKNLELILSKQKSPLGTGFGMIISNTIIPQTEESFKWRID